jgi:quercetin dioxygenase-like cupin family protein
MTTRSLVRSELLTGNLDDLPAHILSSLAPEATKRMVFAPGRHWNDYVLRYFTLPPGCATPSHRHEWEHLVVVLRGRGRMTVEDMRISLDQGAWGYVPSGAEHVFENSGEEEEFAYLCIAPVEADPHAIKTLRRNPSKERRDPGGGGFF